MCLVLTTSKAHIWRVEALNPDARVQCVGFRPGLVPVAFHPPSLSFRIIFFSKCFLVGLPVKVVKLCEVIKESSSSTTLVSELIW